MEFKSQEKLITINAVRYVRKRGVLMLKKDF